MGPFWSWCLGEWSGDLKPSPYGPRPTRRWAQAAASGGLDAAGRVMDELTDEEWLAAMQAHPRIGERGGHAPARSGREESPGLHSPPALPPALGAANRLSSGQVCPAFLI